MIQFDINAMVPLFILNDKNGYAMAKAIEAAISSMDRVVQQGLDCLLDIEKMPEWRLDEIAAETKLPYNNYALMNVKRVLIRDGIETKRYQGTAGAIKKYIEDLIGPCTVEEIADDNCHFRIQIEEEERPWKRALALLIATKVKNVYSILDSIEFIGQPLTNSEMDHET